MAKTDRKTLIACLRSGDLSRGNERVMKALLAAGGDPARSDNEGSTPIDIARANGRGKIVALLRE